MNSAAHQGWHSQPYPPEGASAAEGIRRQLGRPQLDLLTILVRESAQNSWDAHREGSGVPVDYRIDLSTISPARIGAWREMLLNDAPAKADLPLRDTLRSSAVRLLTVSDRGTKGLGGPTRADQVTGGNRDFVSFIRNIGEPRDNALGGGTYGFGKGIFYLLSKPGVILVHTRCVLPDGTLQTRLIGCAMWNSYLADLDGEKRRFTGRHWWGDTSGELIEPLLDEVADAAARRLGLKSFGPGETGTTVVVVDPLLRRDDEEIDPATTAGYLADTIAWHLWPKMIESNGASPAMRFAVSCDGVDVPVPDPRNTRPLSLFVAAYDQLGGPKAKALECQRPKRLLGELGLVKAIMPPNRSTMASRMVDIDDLVHHVCLMRPAELVVTYFAGVRPPSQNLGYAGVFRADPSMDEVYAQAEPPTHDAWNHQSLEYPDSTFVRTTFTRIRDSVDGLLNLAAVTRDGAKGVALGAASSMFSGLVGGAWGIGGATAYSTEKPGSTVSRAPSRAARAADAEAAADVSTAAGNEYLPKESAATEGDSSAPSAPRTDRRAARPRVQYLGEPYYDERAATTVLVQEFRLPVALRQRVRIDLAITLPGASGRETDPPLGAPMPELLGWEQADGTLHTAPDYEIDGGDGGSGVRWSCPRRTP